MEKGFFTRGIGIGGRAVRVRIEYQSSNHLSSKVMMQKEKGEARDGGLLRIRHLLIGNDRIHYLADGR